MKKRKKAENKPEAKQKPRTKSNLIIISIIIILFIILTLLIPLFQKPKESYVKINGNIIKVEIADSVDEQTRGLMFRNSLAEKTGMLFIFNNPSILTFWMKNMNFPLDLIYIDKNMQIVTIIKNALPCKEDPCTIYRPNSQALYVLEINGKESDKLGIKEGDIVEINVKNDA